jgi:hypothetical protein
MADLSTMNQPVRNLVAGADRRRRARAALTHLQWLAPRLAGAVLIGAAASRLLSVPAWLGPAALATAAVSMGLYWWIERRPRPTTDAIAAAIDADAHLAGELRSAHWFEAHPTADQWVSFHVNQALTRAADVGWETIYPSARSAKPWAVAALLAAAIVVTGLQVPARSVGTAELALFSASELGAELPADIQKKLAALIAQLDDAALDKDAKQATLADLKALMEQLDPAMQKKLAAALEKRALAGDAKASQLAKNEAAQTAQAASQDLPDDVQWALENMAARAAQAEDRKPATNDPAGATKPGDAGPGTLQAQAETRAKAEASVPIMREAASDDAGKKMIGGGGPMGGDSQPGAGKTNSNVKGAAEALLLAQALRKELLEASADAPGDNVDKEDLRRKTEQGTSSLGFTRAAVPRAFDPSRAAAPPPVPEARRPLIYKYFIRR